MIAMLAVCAGVLVSCGDDDDEEGGLVGTWRYTDTEDDYWDQIVFNSNGTFVWSDSDGDIDPGTYSVNGDILILFFSENGETEEEKMRFSIKGNALYLYFEDGLGGYEDEPEIYYRR